MSLKELNTLVGNVTKALHENEKLAVPLLAVRARKAAEKYPTDQTVVGMANFLSRREENDTFMSRKELKEVYTKLYSPNTKFASLFVDEIGPSTLKKAQYSGRSENEGTSIDVDYSRTADSILSNALNAAFDKTAVYKPYSSEIASKAEQACAHELNKLGVPPKMISMFAGNQDILVCDVVYETPKGQSHVLVPIEISKENALLPTMFFSKVGFVDLSKDDLESHIIQTAGQAYNVDGKKMLEVLSAAKFGVEEPMTKVAQAVMKLNEDKETPATPEGIVYQKVDNPVLDVQVPEYEKTEEVQTFAKQLSSPTGIAKHLFGDDMVQRAENALLTSLNGFGYTHSQVAVEDVQEDMLVFAVAVDGAAGFKVPVKLNRNYVEAPRIAVSAGSAYAFSKEGIGQILASVQTDARTMAQASPLRGMKAGTLVEEIKQAMAEDNFMRAEEALNVLKQDYGVEAHAHGMSAYMSGLHKEEITKEASVQHKCGMVIETSNSKYEVCGHTGLPLHKVYQDEHGDCHPLYRKGMEVDEEGGAFMANKVFI